MRHPQNTSSSQGDFQWLWATPWECEKSTSWSGTKKRLTSCVVAWRFRGKKIRTQSNWLSSWLNSVGISYTNYILITLYGSWNCPLWEYHGIPIIVRNQIYTNDESRCPLSNSQFWQEKQFALNRTWMMWTCPKCLEQFLLINSVGTQTHLIACFHFFSKHLQRCNWLVGITFFLSKRYMCIYIYFNIIMNSFILYI